MAIVAYISDGWQPKVLGRFASVAQAIRLLCPPSDYYVLINRKGSVTQETRAQKAGLLLDAEQTQSLLKTNQVMFQRGPKLYTISLINESENRYVTDLDLQPGVREQEGYSATTTPTEPRLGNDSGSPSYAASAVRSPRNGARPIPFTR